MPRQRPRRRPAGADRRFARWAAVLSDFVTFASTRLPSGQGVDLARAMFYSGAEGDASLLDTFASARPAPVARVVRGWGAARQVLLDDARWIRQRLLGHDLVADAPLDAWTEDVGILGGSVALAIVLPVPEGWLVAGDPTPIRPDATRDEVLAFAANLAASQAGQLLALPRQERCAAAFRRSLAEAQEACAGREVVVPGSEVTDRINEVFRAWRDPELDGMVPWVTLQLDEEVHAAEAVAIVADPEVGIAFELLDPRRRVAATRVLPISEAQGDAQARIGGRAPGLTVAWALGADAVGFAVEE